MNRLRIKQLLQLLLLALLLIAATPVTHAQEPQPPDAPAEVVDDADDRVPTAIVVQSVAADNSVFDWVILAQTVSIGALLTVLLYTTPVMEITGRLVRRRPRAETVKSDESDIAA